MPPRPRRSPSRPKPPARYSDATLLRAMETAGKLVEDDEAAEAMKEPASARRRRAPRRSSGSSTQEYVERVGKSLRATDRASA